jgi:N-methylhydantoinase B
MRFSDKRYYIEAYIKCANCGVLIYDEGVRPPDIAADAAPYCSEWCVEWAAKRAAGDKRRQVPLPRRA